MSKPITIEEFHKIRDAIYSVSGPAKCREVAAIGVSILADCYAGRFKYQHSVYCRIAYEIPATSDTEKRTLLNSIPSCLVSEIPPEKYLSCKNPRNPQGFHVVVLAGDNTGKQWIIDFAISDLLDPTDSDQLAYDMALFPLNGNHPYLLALEPISVTDTLTEAWNESTQ